MFDDTSISKQRHSYDTQLYDAKYKNIILK